MTILGSRQKIGTGSVGDETARVIAGIRRISGGYYVTEETSPNCGYPEGFRIRSVAEQVSTLRRFFPGVDSVDEKIARQPLPTRAEGYFAIPRQETIASTYDEAIREIFAAIRMQRKGMFCNRCDEPGEGYDRQPNPRTVEKLRLLGERQREYGTLLLPAQLGFFHGGRSVRRASESFSANEFGLGAFEVGCILLTHPNRLTAYSDLWLDCADKYVLDKDSFAPYFGFRNGMMAFGAFWVGSADPFHGMASGFAE